MERWRHIEGHPASLTSVTPPLTKYGCRDLWQRHTSARDIGELQPSKPKVKEGWKLRKRTRGREQRGVKVWGSWGNAECIFMGLCLSSFWVVWSHKHKSPFLHPSFHLSFCPMADLLIKSSLIFLCLQTFPPVSPLLYPLCYHLFQTRLTISSSFCPSHIYLFLFIVN